MNVSAKNIEKCTAERQSCLEDKTKLNKTIKDLRDDISKLNADNAGVARAKTENMNL